MERTVCEAVSGLVLRALTLSTRKTVKIRKQRISLVSSFDKHDVTLRLERNRHSQQRTVEEQD